MPEPNDRLRRARERTASPYSPGAPLSRAELAELVNAWVYDHTPQRRVVELDANYVGKLERGLIRWPQRDYRAGLRAVLGAATDAELGFRRTSRCRPTLDDVDRQQFLRAAIGVGAAAATGIPLADSAVPAAVGQHEIDEVHESDRFFDAWDNLRGGGPARPAIMNQLGHCAGLLNARCPDRLRPQLFAAVAQLAHTAAFMAFDGYAHKDARRLFRFALSCADEAADWPLRAALLSNVARQSFWLDDYEASLTQVELAMVRADRLTPTQRAMLHTGRARALAKLGRTQETLTAIGAADEQFAHADSTEAPSHVRWYDAAEHAGETGHALATLATGGGRFTGEATTRLRAAIIGYPASYVRARTFAQIGLATVLMSAGDPREAAQVGDTAVTAAGTVHSHRIADTLRDLHRAAAPHTTIPEVAHLRRTLTTS